LIKKVAISTCDNYRLEAVKDSLDELLVSLGLPKEKSLSSFIHPGMKIFIKPNWVASRWRASADHKDDLYCVITHPSVIEAVVDKVAEALEGRGEIIIADNPSIDANFEELMEHTGVRRLESKYNVPCHIYDLRPLVCPSLDVYGEKDKMVARSGDPNGEVQVNLGADSLLYNVDSSLFRGVFNEREDAIAAHTGDQQLYTYSKSLYDADVYISIPKLKTHQKVGATLNLKGLVGSITRKNQLVHWRIGYPEKGGDEYPDQKSWEKAQTEKVTHRGAWPGNDTIWRMVADLYQGLLTNPNRKYFAIIDGIMGGEGQGPFCPTAKYSNCLLGGDDLLFTDIVAARYMGIDPMKLQYLKFFIDKWNIKMEDNIEVFEDGRRIEDFFSSNSRYKNFHFVDRWQIVKV